MTETLFALVPVYGNWLVIVATYLSCLAVPMPSSLIMLAAGAFAAVGDLSLSGAVGGAYLGAVAGDQTGFAIGRRGGTPFVDRLARRKALSGTIARARHMLEKRGVMTVYLTTWLFSPLGPYVNFIGGAMGMPWSRFTLGSATGEATWVLIYVGLGYFFGSQIELISDIAGNLSGLLAAGLVTVMLGRGLMRRAKAQKRP